MDTQSATKSSLSLQMPAGKDGLRAGDRIAAAGAFKLQEGMLVYSKERPVKPGAVANKPKPDAMEQEAL